ncbi:hypothetical protein M0813_19498 [Anaeramoeba flamelloides]|uniref:TMEM181 GOLD domain-containing protein n=1 Tax=Anaeramoeba flamelloides TaxID=1746091 RepID=A0ABQ8YP76_9EUKA|nr:hypothetical protein M0813_19498 [Anaeramoeba flamelloides]
MARSRMKVDTFTSTQSFWFYTVFIVTIGVGFLLSTLGPTTIKKQEKKIKASEKNIVTINDEIIGLKKLNQQLLVEAIIVNQLTKKIDEMINFDVNVYGYLEDKNSWERINKYKNLNKKIICQPSSNCSETIVVFENNIKYPRYKFNLTIINQNSPDFFDELYIREINFFESPLFNNINNNNNNNNKRNKTKPHFIQRVPTKNEKVTLFLRTNQN